MDDFFLQIILLLSYSEVNIEIDFHCLIIHILYRYLGENLQKPDAETNHVGFEA